MRLVLLLRCVVLFPGLAFIEPGDEASAPPEMCSLVPRLGFYRVWGRG